MLPDDLAVVVIKVNGIFQKISVRHRRLFGIPRARGGSLNWNSEGKGVL